MIRLENVSKFYYSKGVISVGFSRVNLNFDMGEFIAITGESGSGKSTLLNVISGLDTYEEGEMYIDGGETSHFTEKDFEDYRRKYIGNIFQNFNLVNSYTVYQNIELVMLLGGSKRGEVKARVNDLIEKVGLTEYKHTKASKLSGGQKQRVAIARALAKDTPIIIADEPTGNLDSESAAGIIKLLSEIAKDKLVVIVTHNYDQVEPYITRKIKMHDGKVLEDVVLRERESEATESESAENKTASAVSYRNIRPLSQLRLGVRNAFNIPVKFLLLVFVFLFISVAIVSEFTMFKSEQYENGILGWNYYFSNTSNKRVVIKKTDGSAISAEDIEKLKAVENVDYVVENDVLLDTEVSFESCDGENYIYGNIISMSDSGLKPDLGRVPEKANEILLVIPEDNYMLTGKVEDALDMELYKYGENDSLDKKTKFKIVGIKYATEEIIETYGSGFESLIGATDELLEKIRLETNVGYSTVKVEYNNRSYDANDGPYYPMFNIYPVDTVEPGCAVASTKLNDFAVKNKALGTELKIKASTPYYEDELNLKVTNLYTKYTFKKYYSFDGMKMNDIEELDGIIFVNKDEYRKLFNKDTYQSSVFVKDPLKLDTTNDVLKSMGYTTLLLRDALYNYGEEFVIIKIISFIVTAGLAVALFFISYFVIRIILKSRNVYYSTIRMLGANVGVSRTLLMLDLLTDANIAYFLTLAGAKLLSIYYPKVDIIESMTKFMGVTDYLALYLIVVVISLVISLRYSKKLFKNSTIETIKEEV